VTWVMWDLTSFSLETMLVLVLDRYMVCAKMYHRLRKSFWMQLIVLLGDEAQVKACFGPFGDSANLHAR
jgi:hypothetical protein